jgi:hypothetical protein
MELRSLTSYIHASSGIRTHVLSIRMVQTTGVGRMMELSGSKIRFIILINVQNW